MTRYIFYFRSITTGVWCYKTVDADSFAQAYAIEMGALGNYTLEAAELYHLDVRYVDSWFRERALELRMMGLRFPENFDLDTPSHSPAGKPKKRPEIPFEVFNETKPDPERCAQATKDLCRGIR